MFHWHKDIAMKNHADGTSPYASARLNKDTIHKKRIAPNTEVKRLPNIPPMVMPNHPSTQPPKRPPTMPTKRLTKRPKPPPLMTLPAKKPAHIPMMIYQTNPIRI